MNQSNKYKLVKKTVTKTSTMTTTMIKQPRFFIDNTAKHLIKESIESSNKLDDLLKRCSQIGSANTTLNSEPKLQPLKPSVTQLPQSSSFEPKLQPLKLSVPKLPQSFSLESKLQSSPVRLTSITNYKLTNLSFKSKGTNLFNLENQRQAKLDAKIGKYKLINKNKILSKPNEVNKFRLVNKKPNVAIFSTWISSVHKLNNLNKKIKKKTTKNYSYATMKLLASRRRSYLAHQTRLLRNSLKRSVTNNNLTRIDQRKQTNATTIINKYKLNNNLKKKPLNHRYVLNNNLTDARNFFTSLINKSIMTINRTKSWRQGNLSLDLRKKQKKVEKQKQQYCLFYNRFGRCSRGDQCPFEHDPKRIAICPRFLRGTCKVENCAYSHTVSAEKTPQCLFYASGRCNREKCPYSHVFCGKDAEFCLDFARGFCSLGSNCNKAHLIECPEYKKNKKCSRGIQCPLMHKNAEKSLKLKSSKLKSSPKKSINKTISSEPANESVVKEIENFGASFISFKGTDKEQNVNTKILNEEPIKIRPIFNFTKKENI